MWDLNQVRSHCHDLRGSVLPVGTPLCIELIPDIPRSSPRPNNRCGESWQGSSWGEGMNMEEPQGPNVYQSRRRPPGLALPLPRRLDGRVQGI